MNFLVPAALIGLFAAAIPVIIHLLNRRRFRTIKWAATTFLLKASRESRGKKRLKHILILACRTLAIAALIFAVARPLIGNWLGWGGGSVETVVLVLDRSTSMETREGDGSPSRREAVVNRIADAIKNMGSPRLVIIDSASGEIQDVPSPDVLPELTSTQATDTQADIPVLITKAIDYLQETKPGKSEIWVASDLQRSDWRPDDSRWLAIQSGIKALPTKTSLRILASGSEISPNYSLEILASRRIEDDLLLDLKISRSKGQSETSIPLTISLMGARSTDPERVTISGQELRLQKRIPLGEIKESGYGWVGLQTDNNPRDNAVFFAFGEKEPVYSWLVAEDPSSEVAGYLQRSAAPTGFDRFSCEIVSPVQTTKINWSTASLIIWQAPLPTGAVASQMAQFVKSGGSAIFYPPEEPSTEAIFGMSWGPVINAPDDEFFINGVWTRDDGPWQDGQTGTPLPVKELRSIKRRSIQGDAATLAEWDDKSPLLLRQIDGAGTAIFVGTLPDDRWSNMEYTALHLVANQRMIQLGTDRLHAGYRAIAGSEKSQTQDDEIRSRLDSFEDYEPSLGPYRSGVYRLGERIVAVNRPNSEGDLERVNEESLDKLLEDTPYSLFEDTKTKDDLISEAWKAFLVAVLLFMLAEAILCLQPRPSVAPVTNPSPAS